MEGEKRRGGRGRGEEGGREGRKMREGPENLETGYFAVVSSPDFANTMIISVQLCIAVHGACAYA